MLSSMNNYIDVIVPSLYTICGGGKGLVKKVQEISKVHVIGHLEDFAIRMLKNPRKFKWPKV